MSKTVRVALAAAVTMAGLAVTGARPAGGHPAHEIWQPSCVAGVQWKAVSGNGDHTDYEYEVPWTNQGHPSWSPRYVWVGFHAVGNSIHPRMNEGAQRLLNEYARWGWECGPQGYGVPLGDPFILHSGSGPYNGPATTAYGVAQQFGCGWMYWYWDEPFVRHTC